MKCEDALGRGQRRRSRPARGAWIEIRCSWVASNILPRRAPRGARGLKFLLCGLPARKDLSRPARGAWIEIGK